MSAETKDFRSTIYNIRPIDTKSFRGNRTHNLLIVPDFFQKSASLATQVLILLRRMHPHSVRSNDLLRKSLPDTNQMLYQLSYESIFNCKWIARIELAPFVWKTNILTVIRYPQVSERSACFLPLVIKLLSGNMCYLVDHIGVEPISLRS